MRPEERYATETRALLDLLAFQVRTLRLDGGRPLLVRAHDAELIGDLSDRLPGVPLTTVLPTTGPDPDAAAGVYLFSAGTGTPGPLDDRLPHALVAFHNRLSHRTLIGRSQPSVWGRQVERELARLYTVSAQFGLMGPDRVAWLLASAAANRAGRHDLGFAWSDRAMLSPVVAGPWRHLSPVGLLVGRRA